MATDNSSHSFPTLPVHFLGVHLGDVLAEPPATLLSAIAFARKPLFYCLALHSVTHLHLSHSNPLLLDPIFPSPCHPVARHASSDAEDLVTSSAAAVAAAIRRASSSSTVKFTQRVEKQVNGGLVLQSSDFGRFCLEQHDLFRMVVDSDAISSVKKTLPEALINQILRKSNVAPVSL